MYHFNASLRLFLFNLSIFNISDNPWRCQNGIWVIFISMCLNPITIQNLCLGTRMMFGRPRKYWMYRAIFVLKFASWWIHFRRRGSAWTSFCHWWRWIEGFGGSKSLHDYSRIRCMYWKNSEYLNRIRKSKNLEKWVPHELNENQKKRRPEDCHSLLLRNKNDPFLHDMISDEERILHNNRRCSASGLDWGEAPKNFPKLKLHK